MKPRIKRITRNPRPSRAFRIVVQVVKRLPLHVFASETVSVLTCGERSSRCSTLISPRGSTGYSGGHETHTYFRSRGSLSSPHSTRGTCSRRGSTVHALDRGGLGHRSLARIPQAATGACRSDGNRGRPRIGQARVDESQRLVAVRDSQGRGRSTRVLGWRDRGSLLHRVGVVAREEECRPQRCTLVSTHLHALG